MDLSCIISSGDIELYVLGLLPPEEAEKMEQLILLFPEIREEADRVSEALETVAAASLHAPRAGVRERFVKIISGVQDPTTGHLSTVKTFSGDLLETNHPGRQAPVIPIKRRSFSWAIAASMAGLILSIAAIIYLVQSNRTQQAELVTLRQQLQQNTSVQQQQTLAYNQLLQLMQDEQYREISLEHIPGKPQSKALVFWNARTKDLFLVNLSLPQAPAGKQYQLWAIVDGKPVSAGMLTDGGAQPQKMQPFNKAEAFAITLEKEGGSETPTMEEMYVMGKVS